MEAGLRLGLTATAVEGSHVPGSVWPAVLVVCGGWMLGRIEMGMLTRVSTGSCSVAPSVVKARAAGRGAWDAVGAESWFWFGLGFGLGWRRFWCCCGRAFCDFLGCLGCCGWC